MNNEKFEKIIGYEFKDKQILNIALTHSSFCRETNKSYSNNERLEFLGDALLDAIVSTVLYEEIECFDEGRMTKIRSQIVCEKSLADIGKRLQIGEHLNMGKGEIMLGGRNKESIRADAVEAVIGAVYIDGGYQTVEELVKREFSDTIQLALEDKLYADYKTQVQEYLQKIDSKKTIEYVVDKAEGPDHNKTFYVHLAFDGVNIGEGVGKSKKEAERRAAKKALEEGVKKYVL